MIYFAAAMRRLAGGLASLFCVLSCTVFAETAQLQEQLGVENLDILKNARFVTILTMPSAEKKQKYARVTEVHLSPEEIARLKTNLLDDHNYDFGRVKSCRFLPEVSFKFQIDCDRVVHVFVSPICNQMLFAMGSYSVILNYDPAHERLENFIAALIKETRERNADQWKE